MLFCLLSTLSTAFEHSYIEQTTSLDLDGNPCNLSEDIPATPSADILKQNFNSLLIPSSTQSPMTARDVAAAALGDGGIDTSMSNRMLADNNNDMGQAAAAVAIHVSHDGSGYGGLDDSVWRSVRAQQLQEAYKHGSDEKTKSARSTMGMSKVLL